MAKDTKFTLKDKLISSIRRDCDIPENENIILDKKYFRGFCEMQICSTTGCVLHSYSNTIPECRKLYESLCDE